MRQRPRPSAHSQLVRRPPRCSARAPTARTADDRDERIADVARQLGYGKSRLYSLFSREVGMAPNDYRQRVRIKRCCEKLVQTDDSITSIGISSGFGSSQYFARVFKKYVGVTPPPTAASSVGGRCLPWLASCADRRARGGQDMSGYA